METKQDLFYNILTFNWPKEKVKLHFTDKESQGLERIFHKIVPREITNHYPALQEGCEHLYTSYTIPFDKSKSISVKLEDSNWSTAKRYFNWLIRTYFQNNESTIVKTGFISETQVWIPSGTQPLNEFTVYDKYSLKVQIKVLSNYPEIQLSYDGRSKVFKDPASELIKTISASCFNWVLYQGEILKWEMLNDLESDIDHSQVFPSLNMEIETELGMTYQPARTENKYSDYLDQIVSFYKRFINVKSFKSVIDLRPSGFLKVKTISIDSTSPDSNKLLFGNNSVGVIPYNGISKNQPYKSSPYSKINMFYIFHEEDYDSAKLVQKRFTEGLGYSFKGLYSFAKLFLHTEKKFSIKFTNRDNPIPEIEQQISERAFDPNIKYIAIYLTPFGKFESNKAHRNLYYQIKELLLKREITSQAIDPAKMIEQGDNWKYSLPNIAIAMLAKLNGVPWQLACKEKNELIVGIGAFTHKEENIQYIGSSFSFNNSGHFNRFEYFMKNEVDVLAGSIADSVRQYATAHGEPERLIIHFYKEMSKSEIRPIQKELFDLGLNIPVFIVTVNKTESKDIVAFDKGWEKRMPQSGIFINIGRKQYLLFNNTRYGNSIPSKIDGYPFPIKLKIECTTPELLNNTKTIKGLIDQVYQFSRMYWKSIRQQNLPVTIKYPEMVAKIAPHFSDSDIPEYGKSNLWFL